MNSLYKLGVLEFDVFKAIVELILLSFIIEKLILP